MLKPQLRYVGKGDDSQLLVFEPPVEMTGVGIHGHKTCVAIPVLPREGGFLLAVPESFLTDDILLDTMIDDEQAGLIGPSKDFTAPLIEEDEDGLGVAAIGVEARFIVVDVSDAGLSMLRDYDPVTDPSLNHQPYAVTRPEAIVNIPDVVPKIEQWILMTSNLPRLDFYSAREEPETLPKGPPVKRQASKKLTNAQLAEQVSALAAQMQTLTKQQQNLLNLAQASSAIPAAAPTFGAMMPPALPPVSASLVPGNTDVLAKTAKLLGPPPKVKAPTVFGALGAVATSPAPTEAGDPAGSGVAQAILSQSQALTALVSHLTTGDLLSDLSAIGSASQGLSSKGVARHEKLQQELASGSSSMFLQVQQQIFKKMHPSKPLPKSEAELVAAGISMTSYLERYGGYRGKQEQGMLMWLLAHCMDSAAAGDYHRLKEHLAITVACLEQASQDGNWSVAYVLSLLEEPPVQMFSDRSQAVTALGRPFSPLVPPTWSAIALSYMKEVELLTNKKAEAKGSRPSPKAEDVPNNPSPKRKPKFPKKPKAGSEAGSAS